MNLSAIAANRGKVEPKVTPGSLVFISPVMLRTSRGAVILGSKNSIWGGPPWRKSRTTDLPRRTPGVPAAAALVARRPGRPSPANPREPTRRKSLREYPAQVRFREGSEIRIMPEGEVVLRSFPSLAGTALIDTRFCFREKG